MNWYMDVIKKYAVFDGRARRQEYWMFFLINIIIAIVISILEGMVGSPGIISTLYSFAVLLPGIAVSVRRLHDTDRSGWWLWISLIPLLGLLVLLFFVIQEGHPGTNQYGPNPKEVTA